jgi:hypothetical protein
VSTLTDLSVTVGGDAGGGGQNIRIGKGIGYVPPSFKQSVILWRSCVRWEKPFGNKETLAPRVQFVQAARASLKSGRQVVNLHTPNAHSAEWSSRIYGGSALSSLHSLSFSHSGFRPLSAYEDQ